MQTPTDRARALILVADDGRRRRVRAALEADGHEVMTTRSGRAAAAVLADGRRSPDVVVLDMRLAAGDGVLFADAYRRSPAPHPPIILVPTEAQALPLTEMEEAMPERDGALLDELSEGDGDMLNEAALNLLRARVRLHGSQLSERRRGRHRGRTPAIVAAAGMAAALVIGALAVAPALAGAG
jgi:CheY-like chemotaxis protein